MSAKIRSGRLERMILGFVLISPASTFAVPQSLDAPIPDCTQDSSASLSALTRDLSNVAEIKIPPGIYRVKNPWSIGPAVPTLHNVKISAYGVTIIPCTNGSNSGVFSAVSVEFNNTPHQLTIAGVTVRQEGNAMATAGFELVNSAHVRLIDTTVVAFGTNANYAAYWLRNRVPSVPDTGTFWTLIDRCAVRPESGDQGVITTGIKLQGAANATTIQNCAISNVRTGVLVVAESGYSYLGNAVLIQGNAFEGFEQAIKVIAAQSGGTWRTASGLRILGNRADNPNYNVESIFFRHGGANDDGQHEEVPPVVAFNYLVGVRYLMENDAHRPVVIMDPTRMLTNQQLTTTDVLIDGP